jgi:hypothetical protein
MAAPHEITLKGLQTDTGLLTHDVRIKNIGTSDPAPAAPLAMGESPIPGKLGGL